MKLYIILLFKTFALLVYFLSFLSIRKKSIWVFGSGTGFDGNSKYFIEYVIDNCPDIQPIWITRRKNEASQLQKKRIKAYFYLSFKGIYYSLRAHNYIVTGSLADVNFYTSGGTKYIQLWHGIGIKSCLWSNKNSNLNIDNKIIGFIKRPSFYIEPDFILGASKMMNQVLANMLKSEINRCHSILYPRCVYFRSPISQLLSYIKKWESSEFSQFVESLSVYKKIFLYMPTYRDKDPHFLRNQNWNLSLLNEYLVKQDSLMLIKLHPHMINDVSFNGYSNIIELDKGVDIYPLLPFTNVLITDYSSIYYDYILLENKNIILYIPDIENYIKSSRDLLMDYKQNCRGIIASDFNALLDSICCDDKIDYLDLRIKFWGEALDTGFEDLYKAIKMI